MPASGLPAGTSASGLSSWPGQFDAELNEPRNSGIVGLPPGSTTSWPCGTLSSAAPCSSKQGMQAATLSRLPVCLAVPESDVSICSPSYPGTRELGRCGAHFVGLNTRHIPWSYYGRPADEWIGEHWARSRPVLERLVQAGDLPESPGALANWAEMATRLIGLPTFGFACSRLPC